MKIYKEEFIMTEYDKKFLEERFNAIQKRMDSLEKEMKDLKKVTKSTEN